MSQKLSYQHKTSTVPLLGLTAGQLLERVANKYPERIAIISAYQSKNVTFKTLLEKADAFAAGLINIGVVRGDHVAIWSPNSIEWVIVSLACARGGFVLVQLNYSYKASELQYCVNQVRVVVLICGWDSIKQNFYNVLEQVDEEMFNSTLQECCLPYVSKVKSKKMESLKFIITSSKNKGTIHFDDIFNQATEDTLEYIRNSQNDINMDDALNIQFTSGSTGNPKAAVLSHHNVINNSFCIGNRFRLQDKHHVVCVNVPFFHTFGTTVGIYCALNFGTTLMLPYDFYDPRKSLESIYNYKCSVIYGTPTMYVDIVRHQRIAQLPIEPDIVCTGGAPTTPQLISDMYHVLNPKAIVNICGMTESTAISYQSYCDSDKEIVLNNFGFLGDHIEAKVVDQNNHLVPMGTPGELCVRGYCTMIGYYNDELLTAKTFLPKGWLKTGDKFVMYEDGSGQLIGRIKDIIIRGGENINPKEIENFITTHSSILECYVVGLPHTRLGEEVCACVRLKPNKFVTLSEIRDFCEGKIAHYKIPSRVHVFDEYPKTTSGKIQKYKIIELLKHMIDSADNVDHDKC